MTVGITPYSAPVHSQYHSQDKYGQYVYGYASGLSSKDEIKTADGVTRGGYSYIDANGILQTVQYVSDPINGFRVSASNLPHDLPEVALARAQHFQAYENIKAEHAYISAIQTHSPVVAISPVPVSGSVVVPVSAARVAPVAYIPHSVHYTSVPVSSQYHAQDKFGQYSYGYAGPLSSKTETKTADGVTRGGYSYIDANGVLQSVQYIADPVHGFRVQATNLPEAPVVTLIGPKVTTSVVGPKDTTAPANSEINLATVIEPVVPTSYAPIAEIPQIHQQYNPSYQSASIIPSDNRGFGNPIIVSDSPHDTQPIYSGQAVLSETNHPIIANGDNPILTSSPRPANSIHTVAFPSNSQIVTHNNVNLLDDRAQINNLNLPVYPQAPLQDPVHQLNLQHATGLETINRDSPNPVLSSTSPQVFTDSAVTSISQDRNPTYAVNFHTQNPNNLLINNVPNLNYQIPINPEHAVFPDAAISKDLINSVPINQGAGLIYQAQPSPGREAPFFQQEQRLPETTNINLGVNHGTIVSEAPTYDQSHLRSIPDGLPINGPVLYVPRQNQIQQVQQTPVSVVHGVEQQALFHRNHKNIEPASSLASVSIKPVQPENPTSSNIQGPTGYYTQQINY